MNNKNAIGHLMSLMTIIVWGTTFISTKVLLREFAPVEILFLRFSLGLLILMLAYPHRLKISDRKQEILFAAAGLSGVTLYFLFENIALTYTSASNVGVIVSIAPFFTAILANRFLDGEKLKLNFLIGVVAALIGTVLISFNGSSVLSLNPLGDLLALLAAVVWAIYSILTRKISEFGYNTIQTTRRVFTYGVIFMIPALFFMDFHLELSNFTKPLHLLNLLYLGVGASALCFVTWGMAVRILGAVKTSFYIYMVPVVTIITSIIILNETFTGVLALGTALILIGLFISQNVKQKVLEEEPCAENHCE